MKDHYVKDYKEKELRQYILAYLLITVASIALHTDFSADNENLLDTLLKMAAIDIWVSGLSVLVVILNEMWPDAMKTEIVYGSMPSDSGKEQGEKICRVGDKGGSDKNTQAALPVKSRKKAETI